MNNDGFINENNLLEYLNNKTIEELNGNFKKFIYFMFPNSQPKDKIIASSGKGGQKPDLIVEVKNQKKYVSVKMGSGNSVHQENVELFMDFLTSLNISEIAKIELFKFHWADGSLDGTGKVRVSSAEYKSAHQNEIQLINKELNNKRILPTIVNRVLFQGKDKSYDKVDYIYYGNIYEGHWASKNEIIDYIMKQEFTTDSIHFGPLNYQIWNRCLNFNPKTENRRNVMQVKWPSLLNDIKLIEGNRDNE